MDIFSYKPDSLAPIATGQGNEPNLNSINN